LILKKKKHPIPASK